MKSLKFKTNIQCSSCVAKVSPVLNNEKSIEHWEVDTTNKNKVLTVQTGSMEEKEIVQLVKNAGYTAEPLS
ncbi:heavy-metal-associated domain-containing protein [Hydrotalea lipotrueae]|uniref:heavy-metal-associated domain-containing protein n=1 Tax=Hydrotalea lipotrueae TaxID=2803817 RepID=UPI000942DCCA|nr:cation transporter [Hydrotalea lipotrueae]